MRVRRLPCSGLTSGTYMRASINSRPEGDDEKQGRGSSLQAEGQIPWQKGPLEDRAWYPNEGNGVEDWGRVLY